MRKWNDRTHFFAAVAEAMRRILLDNARRKRAQRRGGGQHRVEMGEIATAQDEDQILAVSEAVEKLAAQDKVKADLVKLRYFVGMTGEEAADGPRHFHPHRHPLLGLRRPTPAPGSPPKSKQQPNRGKASRWDVLNVPLINVLFALLAFNSRV